MTLWTIKAILRGFNISSGLGVNFHKSSLIRINVNPSLLLLAKGFMYSKIESLPFWYLGLLVGTNPRIESIGTLIKFGLDET